MQTLNPIVRLSKPENYADDCPLRHFKPKRAGEVLNALAKLDACSESETRESKSTNFRIAARSEYPLLAESVNTGQRDKADAGSLLSS